MRSRSELDFLEPTLLEKMEVLMLVLLLVMVQQQVQVQVHDQCGLVQVLVLVLLVLVLKDGSKGGDDREHKAIVSEVQALLRSVEADVANATDPGLKETAAVLSRRVSGLRVALARLIASRWQQIFGCW